MSAHLYETDFYAWTQQQADLLKKKCFSEIDCNNVIEELESMGRSEKRELLNRLAVLIMHLLKWQHQPLIRSTSWIKTINEQRRQILLLLEDSPSLKHDIEQKILRTYNLAIKDMEKETGIQRKQLPQTCPYTFNQIMDNDFWPEG